MNYSYAGWPRVDLLLWPRPDTTLLRNEQYNTKYWCRCHAEMIQYWLVSKLILSIPIMNNWILYRYSLVSILCNMGCFTITYFCYNHSLSFMQNYEEHPHKQFLFVNYILYVIIILHSFVPEGLEVHIIYYWSWNWFVT